MQSWGLRSRAIYRDTATEPTKSGVVGLLCCALGIGREDHDGLAKLAALHMGVRVDREGIIERDYHTAGNVPTTAGSGHRTVVSHRYYLADALFLVVLTGDAETLREAHQALLRPRWQIYLGRRAFVPTRPLVAADHDYPTQPGRPRTGRGLSTDDMQTVLRSHIWLEDRPDVRASERARSERVMLRTIVDCEPTAPGAEVRRDHPLSFSRDRHMFASRTVQHDHIPLTDSIIDTEVESCT